MHARAPADWIEPCAHVLARTADQTLVTDDNMGTEWPTFLGTVLRKVSMNSPTPRDGALAEWLLRAVALLIYGVLVWNVAVNWLADTTRVTLLLLLIAESLTLALVLFARRAVLRDLSPLAVGGHNLRAHLLRLLRLLGHSALGARMGGRHASTGRPRLASGCQGDAGERPLRPASSGTRSGHQRSVPRVRHPIYLGYLIAHAGFLLSNFSWRNLAVLAMLYLAQAVRMLRKRRFFTVAKSRPTIAATALRCATASCHFCSEVRARDKAPVRPLHIRSVDVAWSPRSLVARVRQGADNMLQEHDTMLNDRPLRVLVVDDHVGIRLGISRLIDAEAPRMCSVGAVGSIRQALAHTRALRPDVVVLDVNLDGEDGLALIPALQGVTPCAVVVLTSLLDPRVAERAIALGAQACVHKSAPAESSSPASRRHGLPSGRSPAPWVREEMCPGTGQECAPKRRSDALIRSGLAPTRVDCNRGE